MKLRTALTIVLMAATPAFASVTDNYAPVHAIGNGSTVAFTFTWPIVQTSDIQVIVRTVATGDEDVLTETTDYAVSAVNNDYGSGGTVTTVATYTSASQITIRRITPASQAAIFTETDSSVLRVAALEDAFDKLTLYVQQLAEVNTRQITIPRSDTGITVELDDSVSRVNLILGCDSAGNITLLSILPEGSISVSSYMATVNAGADANAVKLLLEIPTITSFAETFLDDADGAAVRATIGAVGLTGDETIAGAKTFSGAATFSASSTIADASVLASSTAPTTDPMIVNKKYVDDARAPYARMFCTSALDNLTDTTWTTITLDTDEFDSGTITDLSNNLITPAVAGQYLVMGQITYSNTIAEKTYYAQLYFNGSAAKTIASAHTGAATTDVSVSVCDVIVFDADDYVQLRGQVNAGAATVDVNVGTEDTYLVLYRL